MIPLIVTRCTIHDSTIPLITRDVNGLVVSGNPSVDYWSLFLFTIPVLLTVCIGTLLLLVVIALGYWVRIPFSLGSPCINKFAFQSSIQNKGGGSSSRNGGCWPS